MFRSFNTHIIISNNRNSLEIHDPSDCSDRSWFSKDMIPFFSEFHIFGIVRFVGLRQGAAPICSGRESFQSWEGCDRVAAAAAAVG